MDIKINLLPPEKKQELRRLRRVRFGVFYGFMFLFVFVFAFVAIAAMNVILFYDLRGFRALNEQMYSAAQFKEIESQEMFFQEFNEKISFVTRLQDEHVHWYFVLRDLTFLVDEFRLRLESLSVSGREITFSGTSDTRDALLAFQDRLSEQACFENVELPLSDLVLRENVEFSLTFSVNKECLKSSL